GRPKRDLLRVLDWSAAEIEALFERAAYIKRLAREGRPHRPLEGRTLALLFQKPSLRTRVTFEVGMQQLGGIAIYLSTLDFTLDERESVEDVARNLERWVDVIMIRTYDDALVARLAAAARVPVINGLTDRHHPCQILADLFTLRERRGRLAGTVVAYVGDGNNVANSWVEGAARTGVHLRIASPPGFEPDPEVCRQAREAAAETGATITIGHDPAAAVEGADAVYTDTWVSMHQAREAAHRREVFRPYQVDARLVARARPDAVVMHCLPAHRGEEITAEVLDGPQSIVFDQAENRLHVQKAILEMLVTGGPGGQAR
ncbi:MAG TPA: ornithine carbamoyltransferase, partial [Thermodesulfobacteriota bacterium]|nr:ornithine carbamoyltransferase [Thermodesulfobacteriota bacterium]